MKIGNKLNPTIFFIVALLVPASFIFLQGGDSMITRAAEPDEPMNLDATERDNEIKLRWDPPLNTGDSPITNYHLYKGTTIGTMVRSRTLHPDINFYNDTSVENTKTYYYSVSAENSQGEGNRSSIIQATPIGPPSAPLNFQLSSGNGEAYLSWDIPENNGGSPILGYKIIRGPDAFSLEQVAEMDIVYQYTDTDLKNGAMYYYAVFAFNTIGDSAKSEIKSTMPTGPPSPPTNLLAVGSDGSVKVTWIKSTDNGGKSILGYQLYRGISDDNLSPYLDLEPSENCTDENVTNGITYYYSIQSHNMVGSSDMSNIDSALPVGVPGRPFNVTMAPGDRSIYLMWEPPLSDGGSGITHYEVQRITKNDPPVLFDVGVNTNYTDEKLANGKTYYYSVRAYNSVGAGPFTEQTSIKPESPPPEPRNFYIQEGDGEIRLYWSPPDYISDYPIIEFILYRSSAGGDYEKLINLTSDQFSFVDTDVLNGNSYGYMISSQSSIGEGSSTADITGVPFGIPGLPMNFAVTSGIDEVTLVWSEPVHSGGRSLNGYRIYRGLTEGSMNFLVSVDRNATTYLDVNVDNGVIYYYSILAMNTELDGNNTDPVEAMPKGEPLEPMNLRITELEGSVILQWDPPIDNCGCPVESYIIYRGLTRDTIEEYDTASNTTYADDDVKRGEYYYYAVSAVNSIGNGSAMAPEVVRISDEAEDNGGINPIIPIGAAAVLLLIIIIIIILIVVMKKGSSEDEEEPEEEKSEEDTMSPENERDIMLQRRKEMEEVLDVPLTVDQAHAHDHDEHHYSYEDLYGTKEDQKPPEMEERVPVPEE